MSAPELGDYIATIVALVIRAMKSIGSRDRALSRSSRFRQDVRWGIRQGMAFAIGYSVLGTIGVAVGVIGGVALSEGLRLWLLAIALYFGGGLFAGAIVGGLRRFVGGWISYITVGFVATFPIALTGIIVVLGLDEFLASRESRLWVVGIATMVAAIWSLAGGSLLWERHRTLGDP